jgi:nitrite reductase/ring-hydroxylating ferredoxin subunit
MTTRCALTEAQRAQVARGGFVRVSAGDASVLVGRVAGEWRAYRNECRHRALPLDLGARTPMSDDGRYLLCNQHGALYRLQDGACILGPCAGERLATVAVTEDGGDLILG